MRSVLILVALSCFTLTALAGRFNDVLNLGDPAPNWKDLPGVDGKKHSLADWKDKEVLVVVFACNSCPAVADYEERLLAFARKYTMGPASKVGLVAINVNTIAEDRLPQMKERAQERGYTFPYIYDETQKIGKAFGAVYTPEFFVLDKERRIAYMGAMDDRDNPALVKSHFLEDAVEAVLKGQKPATGETLGRGCKVRYVRPKD